VGGKKKPGIFYHFFPPGEAQKNFGVGNILPRGGGGEFLGPIPGKKFPAFGAFIWGGGEDIFWGGHFKNLWRPRGWDFFPPGAP